ncbi:uncharacterized protein LOC133325660 [Musca vetustissima]|uniref:uncharacterized protein LOC133325660 n=1 Tax=Musca vetustissima TaxID=27455 RepID=UPI002AB7EC2E|nr:uncharacterized protein LOC133325660 [Musca vetustissima]
MSSNKSKKCTTQVKLEFKKVIENIKLLEQAQHETESQENRNLQDLTKQTEELLQKLEAKPLEKCADKIQKLQRKRQRKKLKKKQWQAKLKQQESIDELPEEETETKPSVSQINTNKSHTVPHKLHHHLKSLHECQRFLKTFELLQQLHLSRGQDPAKTREFSSKLQYLKFVWNSLLQERQNEHTNKEQQLEDEWNRVLFGMSEKTYFEGKPNVKYFLRKRHIWDSYIDNTHGTSIPIGWVIPPKKPNIQWSEYLETS